ncbi:hypothetical protein OSTOST_07847, partial [Ostertagia ostertagi]
MTTNLLSVQVLTVVPTYCQCYFVSYFHSPLHRSVYQKQLRVLFPCFFSEKQDEPSHQKDESLLYTALSEMRQEFKSCTMRTQLPRHHTFRTSSYVFCICVPPLLFGLTVVSSCVIFMDGDEIDFCTPILAGVIAFIGIEFLQTELSLSFQTYAVIIVLPSYCQCYFVSYIRSPRHRSAYRNQQRILFPCLFNFERGESTPISSVR